MADIAFLLLVFFLTTTVFDEEIGLRVVLPERGPESEVEVPPRNLLFFLVQPDGTVIVRRGESQAEQVATARQVVQQLDQTPQVDEVPGKAATGIHPGHDVPRTARGKAVPAVQHAEGLDEAGALFRRAGGEHPGGEQPHAGTIQPPREILREDGEPFLQLVVTGQTEGELLHRSLEGLASLSEELSVVFPVHPRTRAILERGTQGMPANVIAIDPVGYLDMMELERNARLIATDSGGVQKEAFFHGVPCATLRDETEWVELVECGWNTLLPPRDGGELGKGLLALVAAHPPAKPEALYGDGHAGEVIAKELVASAR